MVSNFHRLACKFDLNQSERKSSQVNASVNGVKWPNGVASRPKFSTCIYLRVHFGQGLTKQVKNQQPA